MIDKTKFVDISGYVGLYAINKDGDIYCYPKDRGLRGMKTERIMKKYIKPEGYVNACLYKDGKRKYIMVHVLVAETFIPNPENKKCINHKDGNKQNNSVKNLEWCSYSENHKHAYKNGLKNYTVEMKNQLIARKRKLTFEQAEEIRRLYKSGLYSQRKLAEMFNMQQTNIGDIINNITYKVVNY